MSALARLAARMDGNLAAWSAAVSEVLGRSVAVASTTRIGAQGAKAHGMTECIELKMLDVDGSHLRLFLKLPNEAIYGSTLNSDTLSEVMWRVEGYPSFRNHSTCVAVARISD